MLMFISYEQFLLLLAELLSEIANRHNDEKFMLKEILLKSLQQQKQTEA